MPLSATNVYMNFSAVTFTPNGGTLVPITEVEDVKLGRKAQTVEWQAGLDKGPRLKVRTNRTRTVTLMGANIFAMMGISPESEGTLVVVLNDLKNQAGGVGSGQLTITLANCSTDDFSVSGKHNAIAQGSATFSAVWSDGQTDPLSVVQA